MNVLILGVGGMLGNAMFRTFAETGEHKVFGTARGAATRAHFEAALQQNILCGIDVENHDALVRVFSQVQPDFVVNCVGLVKQLAESDDPLQTIPINSLLPHRLAGLCQVAGARLVQVSTDCVFSGSRGLYLESDFPDCTDLYGRSKLLGEVDYPHAVTVRTSIIGHELHGQRSLINWFLAQQQPVRGFTRALFSGLPTAVLAGVIRDEILPRPALHGLYHVAAEPIAKFDLLTMVATEYGKQIEITPDDSLVIDRSLDATRFRKATGYVAPAWPQLIAAMRAFQ